MTWRQDEVIPLVGGPYDGAEVDPGQLFAGEPPERLSVGSRSRGPPWAAADYDLVPDGDGRVYRFVGWSR